MTKKIICIVLTIAMCIVFAASLNAVVNAYSAVQVNGTGSISLTYSYDGIPFDHVFVQLYKVADMYESGDFYLSGAFEAYPVDLFRVKTQAEWYQVASTLTAYVAADGIEPTAASYTDTQGIVCFEELPVGLYLVMGVTVEHDRGVCTFNSSMLSLPTIYDGGEDWVYDVVARPKSVVFEPGKEERQFTVNKVWKDSGYEHKRPSSVKLEIYRDGTIYASVVLDSENNWTFSWTTEEVDSNWYIVERDVPEGYTVTVTQNGAVFTATNAYGDDPPPPPSGDTSNVQMYVIFMILSGMVLCVLGVAALRRKKA